MLALSAIDKSLAALSQHSAQSQTAGAGEGGGGRVGGEEGTDYCPVAWRYRCQIVQFMEDLAAENLEEGGVAARQKYEVREIEASASAAACEAGGSKGHLGVGIHK